AGLAVLLSVMSPQLTVTLAVALLFSVSAGRSLVAATVAVLSTSPHCALVDVADTCTVFVPLAAMLPKLHDNVPLVMLQAPASAPLTLQVTPDGSGSSSVTPFATPGPLFFTPMSN